MTSRVIDKLGFHEGPAPVRGETLLELEFKSDIGLKYAYILRILKVLRAGWPIPDSDAKRIELCLDEAIQNAMMWGNGGDKAKKVRVRVWSEDGRWGFTISDEGKGFSKESLPDYESEEFLWEDHGRGIFILLNYIAEVGYWDGGRTLMAKS